MEDFIHAINFPPLDENDPTAPRHPLRAAMTSHTTVLDLSLGTNGMNARLDHTFVALFLALIPTLEHVRLRNLILEIPEYAPWSTIVHLPRLKTLHLIDNCPGIVALLDQISIPTNTDLDIEVNTPTTLTTSLELIATVGYVLEGGDGGTARRFKTLSVLPEYGRVVVKGNECLLRSGDPDAAAELRLSLPAPDWDVRTGIIEGIAFGLPLSHVKIVHTDSSILNTVTDDVLCHLLRSLPSLRVLTWTDLDLPPRDEDDIDEFYWDSAINMRAWGESKLFAILDFMQQVINDQVYRHAVTRILAQCAKCGFGINDIFLDFIDEEEESEYEAA